jgi:hypothetical protein
MLIDGELGFLEEKELQGHIRTCTECDLYLKNMLFLRDNIKDVYNVKGLNVDFSKQIMRKIEHKRNNKKVVPIFTKKEPHTSSIKKYVSILLVFIVFLLFSYFFNVHFSSNNNVENLVIQHLDNSFLQELPDIENANFIQ